MGGRRRRGELKRLKDAELATNKGSTHTVEAQLQSLRAVRDEDGGSYGVTGTTSFRLIQTTQ